MTTINKLGIIGVRSFAPREECIIHFFKPLTIILGSNGSGKTTLIECIKMAATGDLPPLVDKGSAFIHDPKIGSETETRAKIRLQFGNAVGDRFVVNRQFLLTCKTNGKQEFKTVEQSLQKTTAAGERETTAHRYADINKLVPQVMQVTKPILENVIFVHQEDSLWPLGDPKKLKEKFDDIFAATRYTKALEAIRKYRKEQSVELRKIATDIAMTQVKVDEFNRIRSEHEAVAREDALLRAALESIRLEMQELSDAAEAAREELNAYAREENQLVALRAQRSAVLSTRQEALTTMARELPDETETSLRKLISDTRVEIEELGLAVGRNRVLLETKRDELASRVERHTSLSTQRALLEAEAAKHAERQSLWTDFKTALLSRYAALGVGGSARSPPGQPSLPANEANNGDWTRQMNAVQQWRRSVTEALAKEHRDKVELASDAVNEATVGLNSHEERIRGAMEDAKKKREDAHDRVEQARLIASGRNLATALQDAKNLEEKTLRQWESDKASRDLGALNETVSVKRSALADMRATERRLKGQRSVLSRVEEEKARVTVAAENAAERERTRTAAASAFVCALVSLWGSCPWGMGPAGELPLGRSTPVAEARSKLDRYTLYVDAEIAEKSAALASAERDLSAARALSGSSCAAVTALKTRLSAARSSLAQLQREAAAVASPSLPSGANDATMAAGDVQNLRDFEVLLAAKSEACESIKKDESERHNVVAFNRSLLEKAQAKHRCPTCRRKLDDSELQLMTDKMTAQLAKMFTTEWQTELAAERARAEAELIALRSQEAQWRTIDSLEKELLSVQSSESIAEARLADAQRDVAAAQSALAIAKGRASESLAALQREQRLLEGLDLEASKAQSALELERSQLTTTSDGKSVEQLDEELAAATRAAERLGIEYEEAGTARDTATAILHDRETRYRKAREVALKLKSEVNDVTRLSAEADELNAAAAKLEAEVASAESTRLARQEALQLAMEERAAVRVDNDRAQREADLLLRRAEKEYSVVIETVRLLEGYLSKGGDAQLADKVAQLQAEAAAIAGIRETISELETSESQTSSRTVTLNAKLRNLEDNLKYVSVKAQLASLDAQLVSREAELDRMRAGRDLASQVKEADERFNAKSGVMHGTRGKREALAGRLAALAKDLKRVAKEKSEELQQEQRVRQQTLRLAYTDLDRYHRALDQALMAFHTLKMKHINKTIRELWQQTYRGSDIDGIEILSDTDMGSAGAAATATGKAPVRRNYNYRVVMKRGDASLDMRGRCSAGQKVLACLVIRLALAESFCLDCGMLALDEPTTNLDAENIESLASALESIIKSRSEQTNFQLLLITHDEKFIELLSSREVCDKYWRVYRDERGFSKLRQEDIGSIL
ncbi:hypothetical protein MMPV_009285 [Pyropia vietnamensis]